MLFTTLLYVSLAVFGIGTLWRFATWLTIRIGPETPDDSPGTRIKAVLAGVAKAVFSTRLITVLKIGFLDAVLQIKVARQDWPRWLMHALILFGFMGLLLLHALDDFITVNLFSGYVSTLNPFFSLRNLLGLMVIAGVVLAIIRRARNTRLKATTNRMDVYAIAILAVIMISGFLLESAQIISEPIFDEMVADYWTPDDPEEVEPLKVYWAKNYGVVFQELEMADDPQAEEDGLALHEESCIDCHDRPSAAFVSYALAKILSPLGVALNGMRSDLVLWYVHFLACFAGLAYLPFSRFFHIISSPLSLLANGLAEANGGSAAAAHMRRAMALDACTHCGTCSAHCSVEPVFRILGNRDILPSEKLADTFKMAGARGLTGNALTRLSDGSFICTDCYRCTTLCPAGIDLQDVWNAARRQLAESGCGSPYARLRDLDADQGHADDAASQPELSIPGPEVQPHLPWTDSSTFAACFKCQTCTNACPVVALYDHPGRNLGLLPHQIMHALGLGCTDMAMDAAMTWDCVTCYQCQEQCPQSVRVTDILYSLKNLAWQRQADAERPASQSMATANATSDQG
jgi:heterodisulfide reductase subunit C/nitrate reductase gamma subunit